MAYPTLKDIAAIALAGATGAGVGFNYTELLVGLSPIPEAITLCAVGIFPILGGWLSSKARNVLFFPASILIGISVALPPGNGTFAVLFVLAAALFQGALASAAFFVGYGAHQFLARRNARAEPESHAVRDDHSEKGNAMSLIWHPLGLVALAIAAYAGLKLPDIDQRVDVLLHRSIITHGPLLPALALAFALNSNLVLRRIGAGVCAGLGVHFAFDLFPQAWQGYALISLPVYRWTSPVFSWICLGASLLLSMCFAVKSSRSIVDTVVLVVALAVSFWYASGNERTFWWPLLVTIGSFVLAYLLVGPDKQNNEAAGRTSSP